MEIDEIIPMELCSSSSSIFIDLFEFKQMEKMCQREEISWLPHRAFIVQHFTMICQRELIKRRKFHLPKNLSLG